jgi:hypothetical protein
VSGKNQITAPGGRSPFLLYSLSRIVLAVKGSHSPLNKPLDLSALFEGAPEMRERGRQQMLVIRTFLLGADTL